MVTRFRFMVLLATGLGLALTGCSKSPYQVAPVSGKVTLDGQPLANVTVVFQPSGAKAGATPGPGSTATTDAQGQYTLKTIGETSQPGAVVGPHVVSIALAQKPGAGQEAPAANPLASRIPSTLLNFDVPAAGTNQANFDLKSVTPASVRGAWKSSS